MSETGAEGMAAIPKLDAVQRRVLGVLMEKALSQPQYYPMTVNAIVSGANQKSNRDPVMELDESEVWDALEQLRGLGLVSKQLPGPGSRTEKYKHEIESQVGWQSAQRAVMAELLLRGPQTPGELRTRCSRMAPLESVGAVTEVLGILANWDPPVVRKLPRQSGQAADRYTHLLHAEGAPEAGSTGVSEGRTGDSRESSSTGDWSGGSAGPASPRSERLDAEEPPRSAPAVPAADPDELRRLREDVENMQAEIGELHETVADLRRRLRNVEDQLM